MSTLVPGGRPFPDFNEFLPLGTVTIEVLIIIFTYCVLRFGVFANRFAGSGRVKSSALATVWDYEVMPCSIAVRSLSDFFSGDTSSTLR